MSSPSLADLFFAHQERRASSSKRLEVAAPEKPANLGKTLKLFTRTAAEDEGESREDQPQVKLSALERERKIREEDIASRQSRGMRMSTADSMELQRSEMSKMGRVSSDDSESGAGVGSHEFEIESDNGERVKFSSSMWK